MPVHEKAACGHKRTRVRQKLNSIISLWLSSSCLALPLKLLWSWGSCGVEWVFFYFSWRNRFEIQGDHLLIHCCLTTQTVQHENPRVLCLTGRSYDIWYKQKESKPSYLPSKSWGPLSLGIMMLSFLVWVKWHSFSCRRKYILPLQFQDCRSLLGEEKTECLGSLSLVGKLQQAFDSCWVL